MKWLKKFTTWIVSFLKKVDDQLKIILPIGISVVEKIKTFVDSPTADIVTAIIPGEVDDNIKTLLRSILPKILLDLRNWKELDDITDQEEKLKAIILEIGVGTGILTKKERDDLKTRTAAEINAEVSGLSYNEVKLPTLTAYLYPEVLSETT
mgnify:CR=1 FL=1